MRRLRALILLGLAVAVVSYLVTERRQTRSERIKASIGKGYRAARKAAQAVL